MLRLVHAAPLLEEERYTCTQTLIADLADPLRVHRSSAVPTLAAHDDPVDPFELEGSDRSEQWLCTTPR